MRLRLTHTLTHPLTRTLLVGTLLGVLILGVGGRIAMAMIAASGPGGGTSRFTFGGTMTVVALGGVSGFAGAVLAVLSRFAARRLVPAHLWVQHALLAALLLLVTLRGLRGTPEAGSWYFYLLVAIYGIALALLTSRRQRALQSQ